MRERLITFYNRSLPNRYTSLPQASHLESLSSSALYRRVLESVHRVESIHFYLIIRQFGFTRRNCKCAIFSREKFRDVFEIKRARKKNKDEIDTQISREFLPIPHTQDQRLID